MTGSIRGTVTDPSTPESELSETLRSSEVSDDCSVVVGNCGSCVGRSASEVSRSEKSVDRYVL